MIVWLASYPRSGNTFLRVILQNVFGIGTYSIYGDKRDLAADKKTSDVVGHKFLPEDFKVDEGRSAKELFVIKTHEYPDNETDRAIYLVRDGRESTLSFLKHQNTYSERSSSLKEFILGDSFIGTWGAHISAWNPNNRENTLVIIFEDLINNPENYIVKIADFLDIKPLGGSIPTFDELHEINPSFFRSGKTDSWKSVYTQEEQISFWLKNYSQMIEFDYMNDIPDEIIQIGKSILHMLSQDNFMTNKMFIEKFRYFEEELRVSHSSLVDSQKNLAFINQSNEALMKEMTDIKNSRSYKYSRKLSTLYNNLKRVVSK